MNTDLIFKIFIYGCAVFLSIFQGNAAVYLFNKMPAEWLCDYDEDPSEELMRRDVQRVKSMPWKYIFSMLFIVINMTLVREDLQFAIATSFTLWLLLELAIADVKYNILPDQLIILLAVCSIGFVWWINRICDYLCYCTDGKAVLSQEHDGRWRYKAVYCHWANMWKLRKYFYFDWKLHATCASCDISPCICSSKA